MMNETIRKPEKIIEVDDSVTKIVFKRQVQGIKIQDESSKKNYQIKRTIKNGLQMTGV